MLTGDACLSAGTCLDDQLPCLMEHDCFRITDQCDGFWDCPQHGTDEFNCGKSMWPPSPTVGFKGITFLGRPSVHCPSVDAYFT